MSITYETMYILRPDLSEEMVDTAVSKYQDVVKEGGGEIVETQHRGKRRLSYLIDKHRDGIYIQMNYTAPGAIVAALERSMRLSEEVIRYLTVKHNLADVETPDVEDLEEVKDVQGVQEE